MTTRDRYLARIRPHSTACVESLADFLEAVTNGADLWHGGTTRTISWRTGIGTRGRDSPWVHYSEASSSLYSSTPVTPLFSLSCDVSYHAEQHPPV